MPPRKRSAVVHDRPKWAKRTKNTRPSEMREVPPPAVIATTSHTPNDTHVSQTAGSLDVDVLSRTISAAVTEALQAALSGDNLAAILKNSVPDSSNPVLLSVEDEVSAITGDNGLSGCEVQRIITGSRRLPNSSPREPDAGELVSNLRGSLLRRGLFRASLVPLRAP